jgi:hypothetical protein
MRHRLVEICAAGRVSCRKPLGRRIVQATNAGIVSTPDKWSADNSQGVTVARAFPFVGRRLKVDPVPRITHNAITQRN